MSDTSMPPAPRIPTVYFIDDSATMREVIKIAFRKESIHVVACHDAASALSQFSQIRPDVVITDVIMPDKDGYEVCRYVKDQSELAGVPVILMSGVVNRQVAERALAVKADELMRKPFQPQELVARVRAFLQPKVVSTVVPRGVAEGGSDAERALISLFAPRPPAPPPARNQHSVSNAAAYGPSHSAGTPAASPAAPSVEVLKLRSEIRRLEMLVKKLHSELEAERQYTAELESQLRVQQETN